MEISLEEARCMILDYQVKTLRDVIEKHPEFAKKMIDEGLEKFFKPVKNMSDNEVFFFVSCLQSNF